MPVRIIRSPGRDLTEFVVTGPAVEQEMLAALEEFYTTGPTPNLLWDMSGAVVEHVEPEVLRRFVGLASARAGSRAGGRTAIIAPSDLQFGLGRMSEAFAEIEASPTRLRAFREREAALEWLAGGDD